MNVEMSFKDILRNIGWLRRYKCYLVYSRQYNKYRKDLGLPGGKQSGEDEYIAKWIQLSHRIDKSSYRLFSHFCGQTPDIVPEDIGRMIIEPKLNPFKYRDYYSDKNIFPIQFGKEALPRTIVCRINGSMLLDENYNVIRKPIKDIINNYNKVLLKPTVDSNSGKGILLFNRIGDVFKSVSTKDVLSDSFLKEYGKDFVLQECVEQHNYISQFCKTSVNTIRLGVYRSVKDEQPHVLSAIMRIGKEGSHIDNAHAGGMFIGIDSQTGRLSNYVCDQYGNKADSWNGIVFKENEFFIPNWNNIISFAEDICKKVIHCRLLALDITLTSDGKPLLIEYNVDGFSYWLFMYTGNKPLGKFTNEIIDYCK